MKRVLVTGLSGVGKSTVTRALAMRGYAAVDADGDAYSEWAASDPSTPSDPVEAGRDWVWRADRVRDLLAAETEGPLFLSGCAANMRPLLPLFDHIILLIAPVEVIVARLASRTTNAYGKRPDEVARIIALRDTVEPLLRHIASHELDTDCPRNDTVDAILRIAAER